MMKRLTVSISLLVLASSCGSGWLLAGEKETDLTDAYRLIEVWLDAQRDYDRLPGLSASVVVDQDLAWSQAFGLANPAEGVAARPDTIYSICSISKVFTAVAIMQLRDAGKLRLDDRIEDLLPDYDLAQQFDDSGPITIRSLLTHSSGLPRESDIPYWTGPDFPFPSREEILAKLGEQKTLYPASTYYQYSNLGLGLLGEVIRAVAGVPYEEYVEMNILQPLELANTRTNLPESLWGSQLAVGHGVLRRDGTLDALPLFQARGLASAFGLSSTVEDLGRFAAWQFRLLNGGGEEVLRAATLREMHRVQWIDPDWKATRGLGFYVTEKDGRSIVGHGGFCPGYRSQLLLDPKHDVAAVVMINAATVSPYALSEGMLAILGEARKNEIQQAAPDGVVLEDYAGRYDEQPWSGESLVVPWQGGLAVLGVPAHDPASSMYLLQHVEGDTFRRVRDKGDALGEEIVFERDESGKVVRFWRHSNFSRRLED